MAGRKSNFRKGDLVTVVMARTDFFDFQDSLRIYATITYTPAATGDCWQFETADGDSFLINPQSGDFIGIQAGDGSNA